MSSARGRSGARVAAHGVVAIVVITADVVLGLLGVFVASDLCFFGRECDNGLWYGWVVVGVSVVGAGLVTEGAFSGRERHLVVAAA